MKHIKAGICSPGKRDKRKRLPEYIPKAAEKQKSELAGTRTLDHRLKRAMLYRLSYQPTTKRVTF